MSNKKLKRIIKNIQSELIDIKALIDVLEDIEQSNYPSNSLLEIVKNKIKRVFYNFEKSRNILRIID